MLENTNKKLVLLTIENNKLRAENQMQRAELSLLRNQSMLSTQHVSFLANYPHFNTSLAALDMSLFID